MSVGDPSASASLLLPHPSTCLRNESSVIQCWQPPFRVCWLSEDCLPSVRLCGEPPSGEDCWWAREHPLSLLAKTVCALMAVHVMNVGVASCLQWLTDYKHFCRCSTISF